MQRTFPINVSSPDNFPSHNSYAFPRFPDSIVLLGQTYHVSEDTNMQSLLVNDNPISSTNLNSFSQNVVMVVNTDMLYQMIANLQHDPCTNRSTLHEPHSHEHLVEPNAASIVQTISLRTTKVF